MEDAWQVKLIVLIIDTTLFWEEKHLQIVPSLLVTYKVAFIVWELKHPLLVGVTARSITSSCWVWVDYACIRLYCDDEVDGGACIRLDIILSSNALM
jgi:hypothetical protein